MVATGWVGDSPVTPYEMVEMVVSCKGVAEMFAVFDVLRLNGPMGHRIFSFVAN